MNKKGEAYRIEALLGGEKYLLLSSLSAAAAGAGGASRHGPHIDYWDSSSSLSLKIVLAFTKTQHVCQK